MERYTTKCISTRYTLRGVPPPPEDLYRNPQLLLVPSGREGEIDVLDNRCVALAGVVVIGGLMLCYNDLLFSAPRLL